MYWCQILLLCFLLTIGDNVLGQEWAPVGATWHYDQLEFSPHNDRSFIKYSVIGDTTIEDQSVKIFEQTFTTYLSQQDSILITRDTCYLSKNGDTVYLYDKIYRSFEFIYNFSAEPGDTLRVWCNQGDMDIDVVVDSVAVININGFELKKWYVRSPFSQICDMYGEIIENIGWTGFLFPQHSIADPPFGGPLRCYSDPVIGEYKISAKDCDFIVPVVESSKLGVNVYPNPFNRIVKVDDINNTISRISIIDLSGRVVGNPVPIDDELDLGDLSEGVYTLRIVTREGRVGYQKLIKKDY